MASDVDICNLALQRLGAKSIASLAEDSTAGRACNRVYEHARDSELRAHPWSFARARVQIAADSTDPAFGFAKKYQLPADYLRMLPNDGVNGSSSQDDWQIEGRYVLTDDTSPINLVYLKKVTDENDFDEAFIALLIARIAMDIAEPVTQSNTKQETATERYVDAKKTAKQINAFERPPQQPPTDPWVSARL